MALPPRPIGRGTFPRMPALDDDYPPLPDRQSPGPAAAVSGNGHGPRPPLGGAGEGGDAGGTGGVRRRRGPGPTVWPATIVVGVALVVMVSGAVAAIFSTGPASSGSGTPAPKSVPGAPVGAQGAAHALAPISTPGRPPANVVGAVVLPDGAAVVQGSATDQSVGLYDRSLGFTVGLSQATVISFYRAELPAQGWKILSQGPPQLGSGFEILGQIAGTDGYYWELGVTVSPTAFGSGGTGTSAAAQTTPFTLRLFAVSDTA